MTLSFHSVTFKKPFSYLYITNKSQQSNQSVTFKLPLVIFKLPSSHLSVNEMVKLYPEVKGILNSRYIKNKEYDMKPKEVYL